MSLKIILPKARFEVDIEIKSHYHFGGGVLGRRQKMRAKLGWMGVLGLWQASFGAVLGAVLGMAPAGWTSEATAKTRETLGVYSFRQPFLVRPLLDAFQAETGIEYRLIYAKRGLIARIQAEGQRKSAEVLLTTSVAELARALEADVLAPWLDPTLAAAVPPAYRDPQGRWYGLTLRARVIVAARTRVPQESLQRYADLATPRWRGRICMRSSGHPYNVSLMASILAHEGRPAAIAWARGLLANLARRPQGNDRAQLRAIHEDLCDVALVNSYYLGKVHANPNERPWGEAVYAIFPNQDSSGTHVNVSAAGLIRGGAHPRPRPSPAALPGQQKRTTPLRPTEPRTPPAPRRRR